VTFEIIIGHNSRTECAKESMKTSSNAKKITHFWKYVALTCDVIFTHFGKKTVFHIS